MRSIIAKAIIVLFVVGPITSLVLWLVARGLGVKFAWVKPTRHTGPAILLIRGDREAIISLPWVNFDHHIVVKSDFDRDTLEDYANV